MGTVKGTLEEALAVIRDGIRLAVPADYAGVAMEATRTLVRRGVKGLHLVTLPSSGMQAELLIGAGCLASIETAAVTLGEQGAAPAFTRAVTRGELRVRDATCPALHAGFQAAEKGIPFMPLRGLVGSDLVAHRPDWRVIDNPFAENDPVVLLPAIKPDVALFHAPLADRYGNVWVGRARELVTLGHAAQRTVVTVERVQNENLLADAAMAPGVLPGFYVEAVAVARRGAWPLQLDGAYPADGAHIAEYARLAATEAGFRRYLDEQVHGSKAA
jgi:glutaconate CoA-transferase subunit A